MQFLERERATMAKFLPGLDEALAGQRDLVLEKPGSPGVAAFRDSGDLIELQAAVARSEAFRFQKLEE